MGAADGKHPSYHRKSCCCLQLPGAFVPPAYVSTDLKAETVRTKQDSVILFSLF